MGIKYEIADDLMARIYDIAKTLGMEHIKLSGVYAIRSYGSGSSRTLARCHALSKIWQLALNINAVYLIEVISERFNKMSREEQDKVLIHELLHIPLSFGGGFKHHDFVNERNVEKLYQKYVALKSGNIVSENNHVKEEIKKHERKKKGFGWF
jgi:predicted metallopeptidase